MKKNATPKNPSQEDDQKNRAPLNPEAPSSSNPSHLRSSQNYFESLVYLEDQEMDEEQTVPSNQPTPVVIPSASTNPTLGLATHENQEP